MIKPDKRIKFGDFISVMIGQVEPSFDMMNHNIRNSKEKTNTNNHRYNNRNNTILSKYTH